MEWPLDTDFSDSAVIRKMIGIGAGVQWIADTNNALALLQFTSLSSGADNCKVRPFQSYAPEIFPQRHCHIAEIRTRELYLEHCQATATASRHTFIAGARKARCVLADASGSRGLLRQTATKEVVCAFPKFGRFHSRIAKPRIH
jgi:hypothetical protein